MNPHLEREPCLSSWSSLQNKFFHYAFYLLAKWLELLEYFETIISSRQEESEGKLKGILGYIEDDVVSINFVVDCRFVSVCCTGEGIVSRLPCDILLFVSYFLGFYILILY
ncbi:hypothetical protein AMTRI_Chr12g242230 [Amborella trichopoda]